MTVRRFLPLALALALAAPAEGALLSRTVRQRWTPLDLPGLCGWWSADVGVTEAAGVVSQWADRSGNGRHFTQDTPADRCTYGDTQINGHDVIDCEDASGQYMATAVFDPALAQPGSLLGVFRLDDDTTSTVVLGGQSQTELWNFGAKNFPPLRWLYSSTNDRAAGTPTTGLHRFHAFFNGGPSVLTIDGATVISGVNPGIASNAGMMLASKTVASAFGDIAVAEFVCISGATLTAGEVTAVEAWFFYRWGA